MEIEVPPPFCILRDFLAPQEMDSVLSYALAQIGQFRDATVSLPAAQGVGNADYRFRRSHLLDYVAPLMPMLMPKVEAAVSKIWPHLHLAPIAFKTVECQLAYHGDGDYFKTHTDNGLPDIAHRRVSYVYYFHREPRQFSGGHLRMYNTRIENGARSCGANFMDIEPPRNSLIIFPSDIFHEVTPIQSGSDALVDLRLTLNGWLCV